MKTLTINPELQAPIIILAVALFIIICLAVVFFGKPSKRISLNVREFEAVVNSEKNQENYNRARVLKTQIMNNGFNSDAEFDLFLKLVRTFERKYLII